MKLTRINSNLNKKAQTSQVFVYIAAIIVFIVVLYFGYTTITDFISKGEDVSFLNFKNDIETAFNNVYSDYGTTAVYNVNRQMKIPSGIDKVCFVNVEKNNSEEGLCDVDDEDYDPIICDAWETYYNVDVDASVSNLDLERWRQAEQNVFFVPQGKFTIKVPRLQMADDSGYMCLKVLQGRIDFKITGRGRYAELESLN